MQTKAQRMATFNAEQRERAITRLNAATDNIQDLWLNRRIWRTTAEIASASAAVTNNPHFVYWLTSQYAQAACVAIRRLTESGSKAKTTNSLVAVLEDIIDNVQAHPWQPWAPAEYRAANGFIDPQRVRQDIEALRDAAQTVSVYVNKHLAHLERKANVAIPTVVEIDDAINLLGEMVRCYLLLLTGQNLAHVEPILLFPWTAVFDQPWRTGRAMKETR